MSQKIQLILMRLIQIIMGLIQTREMMMMSKMKKTL
jgi:hypothetical protein